MSDQSGPKVPKRGEAAWKAVKEGVAERNAAAKKAGQQERREHLQNTDALRKQAGAKRAANVRPRPDLD
jgi:hypothetical protein